MWTPLRRLALALALGSLSLVDPILAAAPDGEVAGEITVTKHGARQQDRSNVVIYLQGVPSSPREATHKQVIRQRNLQFEPRISVAVKGTTIDFPNDDKVFHNVFSTSRAARFDLGLYRSGSSKSVEFKREGVIDVFCNIHPEMSSRVLVVPTRHFAVTDASGRFRIEGVPAGEYPVIVWPIHGAELRGTVRVKSGKVTTVTFGVTVGDQPKHHPRKDGTPYGRYE